MLFKQLKTSLIALAALTVLTGGLYPLVVMGFAQIVFPRQSNGSLVLNKEGKPMGSSLIGRSFDQPHYFWGRLSATGPTPYNGAASSGSNLGPLNPALTKAVQDRIDALRKADPTNTALIPVDLVTASASGLDPHITPAAALYQAARVAQARRLSVEAVTTLIQTHTQGRWLGLLGEPAVNVFELNEDLDGQTPRS